MASVIPVIEMIIYVVIFFVIFKTLKKKKQWAAETLKQESQPQFTSGQTDYTKNLDERVKNMTVMVNEKPQKVITAVQEALSETGPADDGRKAAEAVPEEAQVSTTDYLAEKARQDQIDHAREKCEETRRLQQKSGGLFPAERLFDGDPVPAGKHCVICGYCAAENLVPNGSTKKYSCYFCREPLK